MVLACCVVQVLALLFMARADVGYTVRQAAVHVWKTIVTNTPRTTGEILKTLMEQIITSLGHPSRPLHQQLCTVAFACSLAYSCPQNLMLGHIIACSAKHQAAPFSGVNSMFYSP